MSRGKLLLIVVPAAMAVGVLITMLFLSSLNDKDDVSSSRAISSAVSAPAASQSYWSGHMDGSVPDPVESMIPEISEPVSELVASEPESTPTEGEAPTNLPTPGGFSEAPTVKVDGSTVSVVFKTTTNSTVNSVLVTSGSEISVSDFYNYYNRGAELSGAVEKKATYNVGPEGVSETYDLPDTSKSYWLLINTVDNASGTWQNTVTAVPVYTH